MAAKQYLRLFAHLFYFPARLEVLVRLPFRELEEVRDRYSTEWVLLREPAAVDED